MAKFQPDWKRWSSEFVVIVLGILVALAVDDFRQFLSDRELEDYYLDRLSTDLTRDTADINDARLVALRRFQAVTELLEAAEDELAEWPSEQYRSEAARLGPIAGPLNAAWDARSFDHTEGAYSEMLAAGSLNVIRDRALREQVAAYHAIAEGVLEINDWVRTAQSDYHAALKDVGLTYIDARFVADAGSLVSSVPRLSVELRAVRARAVYQLNSLRGVLSNAEDLLESIALHR